MKDGVLELALPEVEKSRRRTSAISRSRSERSSYPGCARSQPRGMKYCCKLDETCGNDFQRRASLARRSMLVHGRA